MNSDQAKTRIFIIYWLVASVLMLVGLFLISVPVFAISTVDNVILIEPSKDNTLYESPSGSLSNGLGSYLFVGNNNDSLKRRALVHFDVADVMPASGQIISVSLSMDLTRSNSRSSDIGLHNVLADWGEGTSDASMEEGGGAMATINDSTWLHTFYSATVWTVPGGDYQAVASSTTTVLGVDSGNYTWTSVEMIADVRNWIASPSTNYGWIMIGDESLRTTAKRFASREYVGMGGVDTPQLRVEYHVPTQVGMQEVTVRSVPAVIGFSLLLLAASMVSVNNYFRPQTT